MSVESSNRRVRNAALPPIGLADLDDDGLALTLAYYRVSTTEQAKHQLRR